MERKPLDSLELYVGTHGEVTPFRDDNPSISRVIRSYVIGLYDRWDEEQRQKLRPYADRILCTATGAKDEDTRAWMATDWLVRVYTPAFLRLAGLEGHASILEGLVRITDETLARAAQPLIDSACKAAEATRAASWGAARAAVWDAAGGAARDAAVYVTMHAAGYAARYAAGYAAVHAAGYAARDASGDALRPTVEALQESALELLDRMIAVGEPAAQQEGEREIPWDDVEIKNAVITKATFDTERGLSAWLHLDYGGSGQGFGGYMLYGPKGWKAHEGSPNIAGHFIWRVLEIAGVDDWSKLAGRTIRVKAEHGKVHAIGHIIKDDWFDPAAEFAAMAPAAQQEGE